VRNPSFLCQPSQNSALLRNDNHNIEQLVMVRAAEDLDSVGEKVSDGVEGFNGAFGAAREIDDNRLVADDRDTAREHGVWSLLDAFAANLLGETGNRAIGDVERGFGGRITWP